MRGLLFRCKPQDKEESRRDNLRPDSTVHDGISTSLCIFDIFVLRAKWLPQDLPRHILCVFRALSDLLHHFHLDDLQAVGRLASHGREHKYLAERRKAQTQAYPVQLCHDVALALVHLAHSRILLHSINERS